MVTGWSAGGVRLRASVASACAPCGTDWTVRTTRIGSPGPSGRRAARGFTSSLSPWVVDRADDADRLAGSLDAQDDLDVHLVVVALVGEGDDELARAGRDAVRRPCLERQVAHRDGVDPRAVQARRRRAAVRGAGRLLAER